IGAARLRDLFGTSLARLGESVDPAENLLLLTHAGWTVVGIIALLCGVTALIALAVGAAQARGTLSGKAVAPKWSRVSPLANGKNLVGTRPVVELVKSIVKILLVGVVAWSVLGRAWPDL